MRTEDFELLATQMREVAEIVKLFPEELHEKVLDYMVLTLLNKEVIKPESSNSIQETEVAPTPVENTEANVLIDYIADFKAFVNAKGPSSKLNEQEFGTLATYYFMKKAPEGHRVEEMGEEAMKEAYSIVGRKPKDDIMQGVRNAKSKLKYFDRGNSASCYKINGLGEHFVEQELPKK